MEGSKLELVELQRTKTFILGHSMSYFPSLPFKFPGKTPFMSLLRIGVVFFTTFLNMKFYQENKE